MKNSNVWENVIKFLYGMFFGCVIMLVANKFIFHNPNMGIVSALLISCVIVILALIITIGYCTGNIE